MYDATIHDVPAPISRARALALAGIIGPLSFTTLVVVQGFLLADYSHVRLPISALAAWPTGWIQDINFCLRQPPDGVRLRPASWRSQRGKDHQFALLLMNGIGIFLAGVFHGRW
jgi:hypothetical protein